MNTFQKLIPVALMPMLLLGVAIADDQDKMASDDATFKSLDRDSDERLTKTEVARSAMLTDHFAAVDKDSDGYLTKREYTAHMKEMKGMKKDAPQDDY